jgi:hypothetical protein
MTCIQANVQTTMNVTKPPADQRTQEDEVAHKITYGRMLGEWARNVATLSAVNRVLLASGQRIVRHQMELAQDMMADTQEARVLRVHRHAIAFGVKSVSVLHSSNCTIAAIVDQHLMESMRGLAASVEKIFDPAG